MGDVLADLQSLDSYDAACAFLDRARAEMPDVWEDNVWYAFARYIPESVGSERAAELRLLLEEGGWHYEHTRPDLRGGP